MMVYKGILRYMDCRKIGLNMYEHDGHSSLKLITIHPTITQGMQFQCDILEKAVQR